jgi:hypothetical protein
MHTSLSSNAEVSVQPLHNFAARCPKGHRPSQKRTLVELRSPAVQFYCSICGEAWTPSATERLRALGFAEASEASEEWAPHSAA